MRHGIRWAVVFGVWFGLVYWQCPYQPRFVIQSHTGRPDILFTPDGTKVLICEEQCFLDRFGPIRVHELASGEFVSQFMVAGQGFERPEFSGDGRMIAIREVNGLLRSWEVSTGRELASFPEDAPTGVIRDFDFSPDSEFLLVERLSELGESTVHFHHIGSERERTTVPVKLAELEMRPAQGLFTWQGNRPDKTVKFTNWSSMDDGSFVPESTFTVRPIAIAFSPNHQECAILQFERMIWLSTIRIFDLNTGREKRFFNIEDREQEIRSLSYSEDGRHLLGFTPSQSDGYTTVWDLHSVPLWEAGVVRTSPPSQSESARMVFPRVLVSDEKIVIEQTISLFRRSKLQHWLDMHNGGGDAARHGVRHRNSMMGEREILRGMEVWRDGVWSWSLDWRTLVIIPTDGSGRMAFWDYPLRKPLWKVIALSLMLTIATMIIFRRRL